MEKDETGGGCFSTQRSEIDRELASCQSFWNNGTEPDIPMCNREPLIVGEISQIYDCDDLRSPQRFIQVKIVLGKTSEWLIYSKVKNNQKEQSNVPPNQ